MYAVRSNLLQKCGDILHSFIRIILRDLTGKKKEKCAISIENIECS